MEDFKTPTKLVREQRAENLASFISSMPSKIDDITQNETNLV
jgi:hypothetical protein